MAPVVKNPPAMQETWVLGQERSLEEEMATHSTPGKFHGQRSLADYSLQG